MATAKTKTLKEVPKKRNGLLEFLISFRALLQEQKEGEKWKASKGNVGYWLVLGTMLRIWNKTGQILYLPEAADGEVKEVLIRTADVPEYLFYAFAILLTYSTVKKGKEIGGGISAGIQAIKDMRAKP